MKKLIFILLLFACNTDTYKGVKVLRVTGYSTHVISDTFEGAIFLKDYTKDVKGFTPTIDEIILLEKELKVYLNKYKGDDRDAVFVAAHLDKYIRQYSGDLNEMGQKVIRVNCFRKGSHAVERWLKEWILVKDGGRSFWGVSYNLTTHTFDYFMVNSSG